MTALVLSLDTVLGWTEVALDLNAIDHCVPPGEAKAPGPCASSYALGLAFGAIADACGYALGSYPPALVKNSAVDKPSDADLFVGGSVYAVLGTIFTGDAHKKRLAAALTALPNGEDDWQLGIDFAGPIIRLWTAANASARNKPDAGFYKRPGKTEAERHDVDPLNPDQGFYGQAWAGKTKSVTLPPDRPELADPVAPLGMKWSDLKEARDVLKPPTNRLEISGAEVAAIGALPLPDHVNQYGPICDQLTIGTFWAYDGAANLGTPPRLFTQLLLQVLQLRGELPDAAELARLLALANIAMANASIVAWWGKYQFALARPIRWIRLTTGPLRDEKWAPLGSPRSKRRSVYCSPNAQGLDAQSFVGATAQDQDKFTPNFPAYPSGHATFGGACFKVLELFLGGNELAIDGQCLELASEELDSGTLDPFTERGRPNRGVAIRTTDELITANNRSRVLLGVHWDFDGTDGAAAGMIIGSETCDRLYQPE